MTGLQSGDFQIVDVGVLGEPGIGVTTQVLCNSRKPDRYGIWYVRGLAETLNKSMLEPYLALTSQSGTQGAFFNNLAPVGAAVVTSLVIQEM